PAAPGFCSTLDAMVPRQDAAGLYRKPPSCDIFVVGNQADWYIRLAQQGRRGVFTGYPDLSHLSEELRVVYQDLAERKRLPPLNVLTRLGFILAVPGEGNAASRKRITSYLCGLKERQQIEEQLKTYHAVQLTCGRVL